MIILGGKLPKGRFYQLSMAAVKYAQLRGNAQCKTILNLGIQLPSDRVKAMVKLV